MIDFSKFTTTKEEFQIIHKIAKRRVQMSAKLDFKDTITAASMDIEAAHHVCPLKLQELLEADDFNFSHDVFGIRRHLDRETGALMDCFVPRYSKPAEPTECECVGCGCTDSQACEGALGDPCHWLRVSRESGTGVCSECADWLPDWDEPQAEAVSHG